MTNTKIWDALSKTDPAHTKQFSRAGGFKGTALKPMWAIKRLTEQFGPVGEGWGTGEPKFDLVHGQEGEVLVYCTVSVWHTNRQNVSWGVGGDKPIARNRNGLFHDDEAFKKAFTDATMNGFKNLGVGADIHMGQFDDNKYVQQMEREFAPAPVTITEDQRTELIALFTATRISPAPYLAKAATRTGGPVKELRDLPASEFAPLKEHLLSKKETTNA